MKYKLTDSIQSTRTLHRIEALKDFADVKKGDRGGFVESLSNLSQKNNAWVYDNARVYDASVYGDAIIK